MRDLESNSQIIRNFAPSWFAMVMGTGIVSITSQFYSNYIPFLALFGRLLFYFNILLFFVMLVPWALRWILYREEALKDLYSPVMTHFYPTMPIAMVVLASNFMMFHREMMLVSITFWLFGVIGIVFFSLFIPFLGIRNDTTNMDHITPGMFIPPVGLIVIPMAGMAFLPNSPANLGTSCSYSTTSGSVPVSSFTSPFYPSPCTGLYFTDRCPVPLPRRCG